MAKSAIEQALSKAEKEFFKKNREIAKEALKRAVPKVRQDLYDLIEKEVVEQYYDDYTPSKYKRTKNILNAFYVLDTADDDGNVEFKIGWDHRYLDGLYNSGSKYHQSGDEWIDFYSRSDDDNNGIVETGWIFTNFMEGIHPAYFVDKETGLLIDNSVQGYPSYLYLKDALQKYSRQNKARQILIKELKKLYR